MACASVSVPDGGPRDTTPPRVISSYPDSAEINVIPSKITLTFDEYVVSKNINDLLILSPRVGSTLKTQIRKKTLYIEFDDSLQTNTTYSLQINGSIADNNEGNELQDYQLSFSTGSYLDSLNYNTLIIDAFTKAACEECVLFLYESFRDSSVLLDKPVYIARTNGAGYATVPRLSNKTYTAVALKDANKNLKLDVEELISTYLLKEIKDSMPTDTFMVFPFEKEQINKPKLVSNYPGVVELYFENAFREKSIKLSINDKSIPFEFNIGRDTLSCRFPAQVGDSMNLQLEFDTTIFQYDYIAKAPKRKRKVSIKAKNKELLFELPHLISSVDSSLISIFLDSTFYQFNNILIEGSKCIIQLPTKKEFSAIRYVISDSCFKDINGHYFKADSGTVIPIALEGSNLSVDLTLSQTGSFLIQLLKGSDVVEQRVVRKTELLSFTNLGIGNYRIRIIEDTNENLVWDPGDIFLNSEAEKVYLSEGIDLRPNWDKELIISY